MAASQITELRATGFGTSILQRSISLWILSGVKSEQIAHLLRIPWTNIWNLGEENLAPLLAQLDPHRTPIVVHSQADNVSTFSTFKFVRLFQLPQADAGSSQLRELQRQNLKALAAEAVGSVVFVGPLASAENDLALVHELAPHLSLLYLPTQTSELLPLPDQSYTWSGSLDAFVEQSLALGVHTMMPQSATLRGASQVALDEDLLREIQRNWIFLTSKHLSGDGAVSQDDFDAFLSGDFVGAIFAAGAVYERELEIPASYFKGQRRSTRDRLSSLVRELANDAERQLGQVGDELLQQIHLFCEGASGATTVLRQAAVALALQGYPVLVSSPLTRILSPRTVGQFIIDVQDKWRQNTKTEAFLPFIIFLDKDLDEASDARLFAREMESLNRSIILVRAIERSRDEIGEARKAIVLRSDVSENEMLRIGGTLREFCVKYDLAPIPSDNEWRAYHAGLSHIHHHKTEKKKRSGKKQIATVNEEVPYLFLIGIYPFISERVANANALQQYYFRKWESLADRDLKNLIAVIAAAGVYNISIPYDCLRRAQTVNLWSIDTSSKLERRTLDQFLQWHNEGPSTASWYLRIRHPVIGLLLSQLLNPLEADAPYRSLTPILQRLTTKEEDIWFAEELVVRVASRFKRRARSFSLETDTPVQRAARAIFAAIPEFVRSTSRPIQHHEARYHMHVIHACIEALKSPGSAVLSANQIREVLNDEYAASRSLLDSALKIKNASETEANIYNTYAKLLFDHAEVGNTRTDVDQSFLEAIELQEKAIIFDPVDALARYQYVQQILEHAPQSSLSESDIVSLYGRAELRLEELIQLQKSRRLRNMDATDAEIQIGVLVVKFKRALDSTKLLRGTSFEGFKASSPETATLLEIRYLLEARSLQEGFRIKALAPKLRKYRDQLNGISNKSVRTLVYLYRLFLEDAQDGRLQFRERLNILTEIKRRSHQEYLPYMHDEAALLCQLDNIPGGIARFRELRAFRSQMRSQWIWINERVSLLNDRSGQPREFTFVVSDQNSGYARFQFIDEPIKYQILQFPNLQNRQAFAAFVRFTLDGLIATPRRLIRAEMNAMGLGRNA